MNAIILAAGLGSRFKEITKNTHKALLPIDGMPNIERTITYLKQAGIDNIYIVTGHLSEQFNYLSEQYGCHLLYNEKYKDYNSIYSFAVAKTYFSDSYIIDSDVVLFRNIFLNPPETSCYFVVKRPKSEDKEWVPILNDAGKIIKIEVTNAHLPSLLGVSFWSKNDSDIIKKKLEAYLCPTILSQSALYWDNIPMEVITELDVRTIELSPSDGYEMDNLIQYEFILNNLVRK
ncbi:NTP transferase domain-containing protein [Pasteurella canis]|uniref:NTP transferase domain-containing protein n=1 Tax=Pasteurella canis TaxID=753 RepID=UPI0006694646|nr:NTP transferase domain-containing protein [Pasteurella canis]MXN87778.1 NTP transferase domain-containing protein [Pasteurella canis]UAX42894.1 NTP transferase domain-containing protein [Pasteurella canis]UAY78407.1 NTP transferase domain-containing protein [Pasteurella canis]UEA17601.1 NTP transferase domain-containing protein [Pasteurella canis]UEC24020.1 NTP transferase domain-containing protein [Pasteurella canis]